MKIRGYLTSIMTDVGNLDIYLGVTLDYFRDDICW
jgi:hypothetical protein